MAEEKGWRTVSKRTLHPGKVVHLELETLVAPDGSEHPMEIVEHVGAAAVLPLTDAGNVLLVRQFRPAVRKRILEVPAGKLDGGEDPSDCALRELREETGYTAGRLEALGAIWTTPGFSNEMIWLYLALDLTAGEQALEAGEDLEVVELPLGRAHELAINGEIEDAKTVVALIRARSVIERQR